MKLQQGKGMKKPEHLVRKAIYYLRRQAPFNEIDLIGDGSKILYSLKPLESVVQGIYHNNWLLMIWLLINNKIKKACEAAAKLEETKIAPEPAEASKPAQRGGKGGRGGKAAPAAPSVPGNHSFF